MSDIAIRNDQQLQVPAAGQPGTAALAEWAVAADAAYRLAETLCSTQFAPAAYKGRAQEATAAILAGAEVGLSPLASLRAFDSIQGTPAPKAITLRAIAQGLGHEVKILESTPERAVVAGRRKGDTDWQTSTWDLDRARQMQLLGKDQWKRQPAAMLVARATAEVCRWIASDAIMGMPYTAEEIRDQGVTVAATGRPGPRVVSAADFLPAEPAAIEAADEPLDPQDDRPLTADDVLTEIDAADTQTRLDEIKATCQAAGIRDPQVTTAWRARSEQIASA
ncbi:hypothetical protein ACFUYE_00495 [Micromonospora humida]|uniref:hypothetical protein n=1 Tax=Micromonospora humida TaxID=2809018 RepID=UPI003670675A